MKYQVRKGVFETNSSSTHSICICSEEQFNEWEAGKTLFNTYTNEFRSVKDFKVTVTDDEVKDYYNSTKGEFYKDFEALTPDEVTSIRKKLLVAKNDKVDLGDFVSYSDWPRDYLEPYVEHFTTKSGDKIVAFGAYGYDG